MYAITFRLLDGESLEVLAATSVRSEAESLAQGLAAAGVSWTVEPATSPFAAPVA